MNKPMDGGPGQIAPGCRRANSWTVQKLMILEVPLRINRVAEKLLEIKDASLWMVHQAQLLLAARRANSWMVQKLMTPSDKSVCKASEL